ncbi:glycosyl transferase group 1 [Microbacterium sp. Root53]|uniref:rhamnosyltransferase WsaF family glycosyltransferase n=1 Tax=Microbacterium sp. Root53 TaxID=1736553 RepID=UPI0007020BDF|nr:glycosyl transferase group 1 [Microbacterium sp. Root53]KQY96980.1 glycosyl transferase group 1 [Microbacterium sp. Root53]
MSALAAAARVLRREGARAAALRVVRRIETRLDPAGPGLGLPDADVADSAELDLALPAHRPERGTPLTIGWVVAPPSAGSGGHTTLFRMIEAVEAAGHRCVVLLDERHGADPRDRERVIRDWWPRVRAEVRDARAGDWGVDAAVASSWETAHVLASRGREPMRRLYFVQDFEPWFHPRGAAYALAEDTYRFGFRTIALGEAVAEALRREIGIAPDVTPFGCDTAVYRPLPGARREGVVAYARPGVPRRGWELARLALARFHELRPDVPIHVYGERVRDLPFPATLHGRLAPADLNALYARCVAGLAMSFTNISLVAEEMIAAGVVPVVADSPSARADLPGDAAAWARATPAGLARALAAAVERPDRDAHALRIASTARSEWTTAQADVLRILEDEVCGPSAAELDGAALATAGAS